MSTPTSNEVPEDAAVGTTVGVTVLATDPETADTVSYSLDDDAGGRFAVDSVTGVVSVAGALDHETAASHTIVVRATSSDASFSTAAFTISVGDVNEAPAISAVARPGYRRRRHHRPAHLHHLRPRDCAGLADRDGQLQQRALIPNGNLVLGGSGATRTITVTPAAQCRWRARDHHPERVGRGQPGPADLHRERRAGGGHARP